MVQNVLKTTVNTEKPVSASKETKTTANEDAGSFDNVMKDRLEQNITEAKDHTSEKPQDVQTDVDGQEQPDGTEAQNAAYPQVVFQWMTTITDNTQQTAAKQQNAQLLENVPTAAEQQNAQLLENVPTAETVTDTLPAQSQEETLLQMQGQDDKASLPVESQQIAGDPKKSDEDLRFDSLKQGEKKPVEQHTGKTLEADNKPEVFNETKQTESDAQINTKASAAAEYQSENKTDKEQQSQTVSGERFVQSDSVGRSSIETTQQIKQPDYHLIKNPEYMEKLGDTLAKQIVSGKQEFEIQLEPLHLGKMLVKVSYEAGKAAISIICSEAKTMQAISQNAKEIGSIMENHLGTQTQIVVDKGQAADYLEQGHQQEKEQQNQDAQQDQSKEKEDDGMESMNFLQQLRLGLV